LKKHYGARLVSAVVFGSVGRGSPRPDSDVDVLVVAEPLPDGRMPRVRDFAAVKNALAARLANLAKEGIHTTLAPIFKTPAEVRRGSLLFLDMIDNGRVLFDRNGFWRDFIQDFQERLRRLGARKIITAEEGRRAIAEARLAVETARWVIQAAAKSGKAVRLDSMGPL